MVTFGKAEQFPHIRALHVCLACGRKKHVGLIVCWPCHNDLKMQYDFGYGPTMDRVLATAEALCIKREGEHL